MAGYNNSITDINSKVGIGTGQTEPSSKLDVDGVIRSRGGSYAADIDTRTDVGLIIPENNFIYTADGSSYLRKLIGKTGDVITIGEAGTSLIDGISLLPGTTGGYVQIFNNASVAAKFVDGKLGLSNTDPQSALQVGPGTTNQQSSIASIGTSVDGLTSVLSLVNQGGNNTDGNGVSLDFHNASNWSATGRISVIHPTATTGTATNSSMQFSTYGTVGSTTTFEPRMTIDYKGNVGIGTTNPGSKLELSEVSGAAPTLLTLHQTAVDIVADDTMGSFIDFKSTDSNPNFTPQARIGMLIRDSNGDSGVDSEGCGNLVFHTSKGTNSTGGGVDVERMRITDIGNVGIGTSTPNAKLDIQGTQGQLFSVTDDLSGDIFSVADISGVPIMNVNSDGTSYFDGNVGIGTDAPDHTLMLEKDVDGEWEALRLFNYHSDGSTVGSVAINMDVRASNGQIARASIKSKESTADAPYSELGFFTSNTTSTAPSERMTIDKDGNVGIGTTSPGAKLDVNSSISSSSADVIKLSQNTNGAVKAAASLGISVQNGGETTNAADLWFTTATNGSLAERMRINSAGNVGINVTNPSDARLKVLGNVIFDGYNTSDPDSTSRTAYPADQMFTHYANNGVSIIGGKGSYTGVGLTIGEETTRSSNFKFIRGVSDTNGGANAAEEFWVNGVGDAYFAGNVGIGTTNPGSKLEVNGTFKATGTGLIQGRLSVGTSSSSDIDMLRAGGNYITATNASGVLYFRTVNDIRMAILANGNIGIKTTNPGYLLDVRDGTLSGAIARFSAVNAHVIIESSTAGPAVLHLKPNATGNKSGQFKVTTGEGYNFRWSNDAASTAEVTYMKLDTSTTGGGDLTVKGDIIAYGAPSDERYKENIKPIESALDKALKLQGVTFDWKESDSILDIKEDIGFIAQDVQKVIPELVRENEDGKLSLRYQGVTPILLEAIKELKAEIEELKKQIK